MKTCVYKVILLGNTAVGKTTLFRKLIENPAGAGSTRFVDSIELGPCTLEFTLTQSVKVQLEVNDTGSIERFRGSIPTNYFRHTQGVVLMYDLTDPTSLYDLEDWVTDANNKTCGDDIITYALIGNKLDEHSTCDIGENSGRTFCARHAIPEKLQFQTSAAKESSESLLNIFEVLAREIYTVQMNKEPEESRSTEASLLISDKETVTAKRRGCSRC